MKFFDVNSLNDEQKFALFYGVMLGDGCLSHYKTKDKRERGVICITGSFGDDRPFYKHILTTILKSFGRKSVTIKDRSYSGAIEINFPDKNLFDRIQSFGLPIGKKGPNIVIPQHFYDKNQVNFVVAGFIATDGSLVLTKNPNKYYPRIEGNGISKGLIKQVHEYLRGIGMNGAFYLAKRKHKGSDFNVQSQYRFQFNGVSNLQLFNEKIGFANPKHQKKFECFLEYNKNYERKIKGVPTQKQKDIRLTEISGWRGS